MRRSLVGARWMACIALGWVALESRATAQQQRPASAVQLPSFSTFSVRTAVSVPDRGGAFLGGMKYAADGRSEFGVPGLPGNRAIGSERAARGVFVSAQIHDLHEMDSMLLSPDVREARAQRRAQGMPMASGEAGNLPNDGPRWARGESREPIRSVAAIRRQREAAAEAKRDEALALVERGEKAQAEGKSAVARIHYQMAARRLAELPPDSELTARLRSLLQSVEPTNK